MVVCARKCTKEIMSFVFAGVWLGAESKKSLTSTPANVEDMYQKKGNNSDRIEELRKESGFSSIASLFAASK